MTAKCVAWKQQPWKNFKKLTKSGELQTCQEPHQMLQLVHVFSKLGMPHSDYRMVKNAKPTLNNSTS